MEQELEERQIIMCTVDKIVGTTVFVKLDDYNKEGTITTPEIAPGRIRNLRAYVIPGKKIVCKILSMKNGNIHLSLRRVKQNEKRELLDRIKKEKNFKSILKTVLKEETEKVLDKITQKQDIIDFFEQIKEKPKLLEKYANKKQAEQIIKILKSKKEKPKEIKQIINLSSKSPDGIKIVKNIINQTCKNSKCDVSYLAAGKYSLNIIGEDFKKIKTEFNKVTKEIEKQAKSQRCEFELEKIKH